MAVQPGGRRVGCCCHPVPRGKDASTFSLPLSPPSDGRVYTAERRNAPTNAFKLSVVHSILPPRSTLARVSVVFETPFFKLCVPSFHTSLPVIFRSQRLSIIVRLYLKNERRGWEMVPWVKACSVLVEDQNSFRAADKCQLLNFSSRNFDTFGRLWAPDLPLPV